MKLISLSLLITIFVLSGCATSTPAKKSSGGSKFGISSSSAVGVITLSGADTAKIGTQLVIGDVAAKEASGFQPDYILMADSASTLSQVQRSFPPDSSGLDNAFVMVVVDDPNAKGISMSVMVNGDKHDYTCSNTFKSSTCGSKTLSIDFDGHGVSMDNVTVKNAASGSVLTLNGTVSW